jgi:hypothetical protein
MQNDLLAILQWILRFLRPGVAWAGRLFVLSRELLGDFGAGFPGASADFDSARLDAVSRSLLWGAGVPAPERAARASCPPGSAAGALAWNGIAWNGTGRRWRRIDPCAPH